MTRNNKSARKAGSMFERRTAEYLARKLQEPRIERRAKSGSKDRGDINGVYLDGERVVLEVKNRGTMAISQWLDEARTEAGNDDAAFYAVVAKRRGIGMESDDGMGQQLVLMTLEQFALILNHGIGFDDVGGVR